MLTIQNNLKHKANPILECTLQNSKVQQILKLIKNKFQIENKQPALKPEKKIFPLDI